ncbi:hypothetical protein CALVIDRAFT_529075 [Calocera viscosa TUFC12733]|uniref:Uncharacterized protein n=1 Tax=Calocera viscosa (strain TUFC12733) TaxID=1330018 RepID=A0A167JX12_CALVF|nr:hypothetical protein CALVIDRAFT_529075 [Calocera viscosa TUFC12733]
MHTAHPLPPVNRLPREVLTTIFLLASHPPPPYRPPNLAHIPTPHTPTVISHVCRTWRVVAFSTPRLWTDIRVMPLKADKAAFIDFATRCAPHTFALSIRTTHSHLGWVSAVLPTYLPRCHSLRITGQIDEHPNVKLSFFPGHVPIRSLELIHIELPSMRVLIDMLEYCPSLERLTMRDLHMESEAPGSVRQRRKLKSLKRLALQVDENFDIIQGFFPRVITPNLQVLELAYGPEGPHVVGPFIIYDDCMASVTSLIMRGEVLATDFVLSMMQKAIPLRSLTLLGCGVTDEFLQVLAKRQSNPDYMSIGGGGYTAPKLERVILRGCDYVSGTALVQLVRERRSSSDPDVKVEDGSCALSFDAGRHAAEMEAHCRPSRMRWVEATNCEGVGREDVAWLEENATETLPDWDDDTDDAHIFIPQ